MTEMERYRSHWRSHDGIFIGVQEVSLGDSPYGKVVKRIGRNRQNEEVRYGIQGTLTEITGFSYENDAGQFFELLEIFSPNERDLTNIRRLDDVMQALEKDCSAQGIHAITTMSLPQFANAFCRRYRFRPSGQAEEQAIKNFDRRAKYQANAISLYKVLS